MHKRTHLGIVVILLVLASALTACSKSGPTTSSPGSGQQSQSYGVGVTANTVKVGIALVDFTCIEQFVNQIRDQPGSGLQRLHQVRQHTTAGWRAGSIVPDYQSYCPIQNAQALALCTKFTEDDHVFAVMGDFVDFSGDAQTCIAKDHNTVLMTFELTQADHQPVAARVSSSCPAPHPNGPTPSSSVLMKKQHTLKGKKIAVLGELASQNVVNNSVVPGLKSLGVPMGSTAILDVTGADTSAAQTQLDSFIERWKSEDVNALYVSGTQVASQQFIEKVRARDAERDAHHRRRRHRHPRLRPARTRGRSQSQPLRGHHHRRRPDLPGIRRQPQLEVLRHDLQAGDRQGGARTPRRVIPGPNGKTLDTYGSINDACQLLTEFQEIGQRVGQVPEQHELGPRRRHTTARSATTGAGQYALAAHGQVRRRRHVPPGGVRLHARTEGRSGALTPLEDIPGS